MDLTVICQKKFENEFLKSEKLLLFLSFIFLHVVLSSICYFYGPISNSGRCQLNPPLRTQECL